VNNARFTEQPLARPSQFHAPLVVAAGYEITEVNYSSFRSTNTWA